MFKNISINLKGPICKCEKQDLTWGWYQEEKWHGLFVRCEICSVVLRIPPTQLVARILFEVGYPQGIAEKTDGTKSNLKLTENDKKFLRDLNIRID